MRFPCSFAHAKRRQRNRPQAGQAAVEFIFSIIFLMLFIAGIIEVIMMVYTYNVLADSAKEGVRYAVVHGASNTTACSGPGPSSIGSVTCDGNDSPAVISAVQTYASYSAHSIPSSAITVDYPDGNSTAPNRVRVSISYAYQPLFGLGWPTVTVNAAAEGRIMY